MFNKILRLLYTGLIALLPISDLLADVSDTPPSSGSNLFVEKEDVLVTAVASILNFGDGFGVTESPTGKVNIEITATGLSSTITSGQVTDFDSAVTSIVENYGYLTTVDLTSDVTGVLPVANGGTSFSTTTTGDIVYATDTDALGKLPSGTAGFVLTAHGAGTLPTYESVSAGSGDVTSVGDCTTGACFDGTQGTTLTFNNAGGDGTFSYNGTSFVLTHPLDLTASGIRATGAVGVLTLAGLGNTNNENLTIDLETTSNKAVLASSTGVTDLNITTMNLGLLADDQSITMGTGSDVVLKYFSNTTNDEWLWLKFLESDNQSIPGIVISDASFSGGNAFNNTTEPFIAMYDDAGTHYGFFGMSSANINLSYDSILSGSGITISGTEVIVNDGGNSTVDFRVESDNFANAIFVDASGDTVGLMNASPTANVSLDIDHLNTTSINANMGTLWTEAWTGTLLSGGTTAALYNVQFLAPTLQGVAGGGTETVTAAATLYIDKAPVNGGNLTLSNAYALWVDDGLVRFDGGLDVTGTVAATTVTGANVTSGADPGHTHTGASISGIDISADTNLTAGDNLTLTDDDLDLDAAVVIATSITSPIFISNTADPADAGIIRFANAEGLAWEASPAGTDMTLLVDSAEILQYSGVFNAVTVTGANVTSGANPGHTHTGSSLSGIDISDDTNLAGDTEIVLTGDALSIGAAITRDTEWDTQGEVETAWGSVNILLETEIDASSELAALMDDETGTGFLVFSAAPALTGAVTFGNGATSAGTFRILEDTDDGSNYTQFSVPALAGNITYTLPANDGDASQFLQTDGSGVLTWATSAGSGDITDVFSCSTGDCNAPVIASGEKLDGGTATADATGEGIILTRATDCSAATDEGHVCWDTDDDKLYVGDGTVARLANITPQTMIINSPTAAGDGPVFKALSGMTILSVNVLCVGGTNWVGHVDECDANGGSCTTVDSSDITASAGTNATDDGSLSNSSIDANDWVGVHTTSVSGSVTRVLITIKYR